ncbi:MAG: D-alanyl-D-alanine carboxypeptidase [Deltaproteobacteria bacterium]|nr:D-alanyl-D-alanine carboxypeptidase [Deltaproteobacteria bacterium]
MRPPLHFRGCVWRGAEVGVGVTSVLVITLTALSFSSPALASPPHPPKFSAKAVLILHNKTGKALVAKRANAQRAIASLTKLQVALVLRRRGLDLKKGTTITRADHKVALRGSRSRLELKWVYRNSDLLHASLMSSDNRATSALGRSVKLSANGLVQAMNELARRQGLHSTVFKGPVGIDHGNKSTCWEVSRIARQAAKDRVLRGVMSTHDFNVKPLKGYLRIYYRNTNPLVGKTSGVKFLASKTGYNDEAGYCIAFVAKVRRLGEVTVVLLGSKSKVTRIYDARHALNWLKRGGRALLKTVP